MYPTTVAAVLDWYAATTRHVCAESERERRRIWQLFTAALGEKTVDSCRPADLLAFIDARTSLRSPWTRKRWLATILRPFNHAARLGLIARNPFWGLCLPQGDDGRDWTRHEFQAALRHCAAYFRRVITFMRWTGARPGEARSACVTDVDFETGIVELSEHKTRRISKRSRIVYLCPVALKLIRWLVLHGSGGHLFLNGEGRPWTRSAFNKHFRAVRRRAGLKDDVVPHGCRHTFGTGAIVNGVDLATLAALMGHASVSATERYVHLAKKTDHLKAAAARAVKRP